MNTTAYTLGQATAQMAIIAAKTGDTLGAKFRYRHYENVSDNPKKHLAAAVKETMRNLSTLDKAKADALNETLAELMAKIPAEDLPSKTSDDWQCEFALGFYQYGAIPKINLTATYKELRKTYTKPEALRMLSERVNVTESTLSTYLSPSYQKTLDGIQTRISLDLLASWLTSNPEKTLKDYAESSMSDPILIFN